MSGLSGYRLVLVPLAVVFVLALAAGSAEATYPRATLPKYVKYDQTGPFLWGNLTWKAGVGKIVWGPAVDTEPQGAGGSTPSETLLAQHFTIKDNTGIDPGLLPPPDEFTSDPLPMRVYLNVSKNILFDLQLKKGPGQDPCPRATPSSSYAHQAYSNPQLDVEVLLGDQLIGGALGHDYIYWHFADPSRAKPSDAPGHSTCRFGISPEVGVLEPNSVLRIRVIHVRQSQIFPFGFGGEHPSTIRLPLYPPEEVFYRYPDAPESKAAQELEATTEEMGASSSYGAQRASPLASVGSTAAVFRLALVTRPRRTRVVLLAGLLVAVGASGCLSKGGGEAVVSETLAGRATSTLIADGFGLTDVGRGSIIGQVRDDLHIPLPGVHVSIIGFPNFTTTDGKGQFKFLNLLPALYKVRFDKILYNSFEAELEVKAGFVNKPDITLVIADAKERDARPHDHDYWPVGVTKKKVMDQQIFSSCNPTLPTCLPQNPFSTSPKEGDSNTIIPGTSSVEVVLTFEKEDLGTEELALAVMKNDDNRNASVYPPRPSGVPFRIPTNWEQTDRGHQPYSSWTFYWVIPHRSAANYIDYWVFFYSPPAQIPTVHAKISIERGTSLPLEPGHPDVWGDATSKEVAKNQAVLYSWPLTPPAPGEPSNTGKYSCSQYKNYPLPKRIEPGTQWVEITLKQDRAASPHFEWVLRYKSGDVPAAQAQYETWNGYKTVARAKDFDGSKTVWKVPIKEHEADNLYGKTATWIVFFEPENYDAWWQDGLAGYAGNVGKLTPGYLSLTCEVVAHRTPGS